jgi:hypothetical protein
MLSDYGIGWEIIDDGTLDTVIRVTEDLLGTKRSVVHRFDYFAFWPEVDEAPEVEIGGVEWQERRDEGIETMLSSMRADGDLFHDNTERGV